MFKNTKNMGTLSNHIYKNDRKNLYPAKTFTHSKRYKNKREVTDDLRRLQMRIVLNHTARRIWVSRDNCKIFACFYERY